MADNPSAGEYPLCLKYSFLPAANISSAWPIADESLSQQILDIVQQAQHARQLKKGANEGKSSPLPTPHEAQYRKTLRNLEKKLRSPLLTVNHSSPFLTPKQQLKPSIAGPPNSSSLQPTHRPSPSSSTSLSWQKTRTVRTCMYPAN